MAIPRRLAAAWARRSDLPAWLVFFGILLGGVAWRAFAFDHFAFDVSAGSMLPLAMAAAYASHHCDGSVPVGPPIDPTIPCGSYSRFSSDLQSEESNADQQRKCREKATLKGHQIWPELEFADEAVSGTKRHRAGLDAMLAAAEAGKIKVLYFFSLSRLARESVITLPLLKHLVYNCGVRIISCTEGIDSIDTAWELIAHIMSIVHEQYIKDLAANVLRGQEGALLAGFSLGDYCFGYSSVPIPGSEKGRRGRNAKPRKMYVIDAETVAWVARIFHWFVEEQRTLSWIARELNRLRAPQDHRAGKKKGWRHQYLPRLLSNRKFIGWWPWGQKRNVRNPLNGDVRQEDRPETEHQKWLRHFPHLQVVDNETFERARQLLKENDDAYAASRGEKGKLKGSQPGTAAKQPRHLLSGLIKCGHCGRTFYVGGAHGKYLFCPGYHMGVCPCQTQLRRDLAERMILEEIGRRILANPAWRQLVFGETLKAWNTHQAHVPTELAAAEKALAEVEQKIANLLDRMEDGQGGPELNERLVERRAEKQKLTENVDRLRRANTSRPAEPTEAWVNDRLRHLDEVLHQATPAAALALRNLVGGQIVVTEIRQPSQKRHYLQGRFTIRVSAIVHALLGGQGDSGQPSSDSSDTFGEEIVIDFREPPQYEDESERAKELFDKDWLMVRIAREMGKTKSYVRKLIKHWFESHGLPVPDGRSRRSTLKEKHQVPPMFEALADPVAALLKEDLLIEEIAARLRCCRETITKVIEYLRTVRGLDIPDGRTRRKGLDHKVSPPRGDGKPHDDDHAAA
jgi:DNA invertase Pin-like site-specific DNA recombinase